MESKTNYTVVGIGVLVLAIGIVIAAIWLSLGFDHRKYDTYTVYVREAVSGLSDDSIVKYNGVKVGVVSKIELNQVDPQEVRILLKIEQGVPITTSTQATLITQGITGTTYLGLSASTPSLFPLQKTPGEPYPVIPYKPSFLNQLEKNLNNLSIGLKQVFNKKNARYLKDSLKNLETVTDALAENKKAIDQSLKDLPEILSGLKISVRKFNAMAVDLSQAGKNVTTTMRTSRDAVDKLSQQALPPFTLFMQKLDAIAANIERLSVQLRQNPAVIIRGNAPPQSGPGE